MPRGLFLFLLAVHQLSNDFCHKEKQHANSGPSPFYLPLPSPHCNHSPLPSAGSPSFKCRSALALLIHSLPVVGRWQLYFSYSNCYWVGGDPSFCSSFSHCGVRGRT